MEFEAADSWDLLIRCLEDEANPQRRALLSTVARHIDAEVAGDIDGIMATLVPEPRYEFWGKTDAAAPTSAAEVRGWYEQLVGVGLNRQEFDVSRVVVDDNTVITEGVFRHAVPGAVFESLSADAEGHPIDAGARYLMEYQALVVWPFDGELLRGEVIYAGEDQLPRRKLRPGEFPHLGLAPARNMP